jgi:hypothetical protein
MKKIYCSILLFIINSFVFSQNIVTNCLSYLGKSVPDDFIRKTNDVFTKDDIFEDITIVLITKDDRAPLETPFTRQKKMIKYKHETERIF